MSSFITKVAGYRFHNAKPATPGEPVQFVREPKNVTDHSGILIDNASGERIGYLFREIAEQCAVVLNHGFERLVGRLAAPGEPCYDPALADINLQLYLWVYAAQVRLDEPLGQTA